MPNGFSRSCPSGNVMVELSNGEAQEYRNDDLEVCGYCRKEHCECTDQDRQERMEYDAEHAKK